MGSRWSGLGPMGKRLGYSRGPMAVGRAAGRWGPGQRSSLVGSCSAESSRWCAERFIVSGAVRPSHSPRHPGPVRACVSAPAPRGRCEGRRATASGEGASRDRGFLERVSWKGPAGESSLANSESSKSGALSVVAEPPPFQG